MKVYLDTSALVKRYLEEQGSDIVDSLFERAYKEEIALVASQWNIGESVVVFDKYRQRGIISDALEIFKILQKELYVLSRLGSFKIVPVSADIIVESLPIIFRHHIYIADAVQIVTCRKEKCDFFLTFDKKLESIAKLENIKILF